MIQIPKYPSFFNNNLMNYANLTAQQKLNAFPAQIQFEDKVWEFQRSIGEGTFGKVSEYACGQQKIAVKKSAVQDRQWEKAPSQPAIGLVNCLGYHVFEHDSNYMMLYYPLASGDLSQLWEKKIAFSRQQVIHILRYVLQGLAAYHDQGKMHLDLKANNVLFFEDYSFGVADFGFGGAQHAAQITPKQSYCSPQGTMRKDLSILGCPADIWSFGCLAYMLATNIQLFVFPRMKESKQYSWSQRKMKFFKIERVEGRGIGDVFAQHLGQQGRQIAKCLIADPSNRPNARQALQWPIFKRQFLSKQQFLKGYKGIFPPKNYHPQHQFCQFCFSGMLKKNITKHKLDNCDETKQRFPTKSQRVYQFGGNHRAQLQQSPDVEKEVVDEQWKMLSWEERQAIKEKREKKTKPIKKKQK